MGIYDREYYRKDGPSFLGSLARQGVVWRWLVAVNVLAFIVQLATRSRVPHHIDVGDNVIMLPGMLGASWFTRWFELDTGKVLQGQVWRLLTMAFLHDPSSIWHLVFNMLVLWWAGSEVEEIYGPREFLSLYLVAAVVSSSAYCVSQLVMQPGGPHPPALGASGAIMAVFTIFALHYPTRIVYFIFFPVPVIVLLVLYVANDAYGLLVGDGQPIAFAAHLGGAAFGYLYHKLHWRITNLWPSGWQVRPRRARPNLRVYRGESEPGAEPVPVTAPTPPRPMPDSQLEAELDAVLEKVAKHGKSSLTERENQILMRASEIYRNRRK
jgi:membrane associated rhomboid family serine protease